MLSNYCVNATIKITPHEAYFGKKPNLAHLKRFGALVRVHVPKKDRKALSAKTVKMKFAGFKDCTVNCFVMDLKHTFITTATSVHFVKEDRSEESSQTSTNDNSYNLPPLPTADTEDEHNEDSGEDGEPDASRDDEQPDISNRNEPVDQEKSEEDRKVAEQIDQAAGTISNCHMQTTGSDKPSERTVEFDIKVKDVEVPKSIKDIESNRHRELWWNATDSHYLKLIGARTWDLVPPEEAKGYSILHGYFLHSLKSSDGVHVDRFKARFVIDGSRLENTADYVPLIHADSYRAMMAAGVALGMEIHTIDIEDAYINSPNDTEHVYMHQPSHYICPDRPSHLCKIKKALFGLPNSGYNWYATFSEYLKESGFTQLKLDQCIFRSVNRDIFILLYVDDTAVMAKTLDLIESFKRLIAKRFKYRDGGPLKQFLGLEFKYNRSDRCLFMNTKAKISEMYKEFHHILPAATKVPLDATTYVYRPSPLTPKVWLYQRLIGSLNYIATRTRPDLLVYVSVLSRFMRSPTELQLEFVLKLVAHMCLTYNYELGYKPDGSSVVAYADATFGARECFDGKPMYGTVVMLSGMVVSWSSGRQTMVADENCLAELYAANMGLKAGQAIKNLLTEAGLMPNLTLELKLDNKSAKSIAERSVGKHSKHYSLALLNIHESVRSKEVKVSYVPSAENAADLFTKFVANGDFYHFRSMLGIENTKARRSERSIN